MIRFSVCALALAALAAPLQANEQSVAYFTSGKTGEVPVLLSAEEQGYYGSLFEAIEADNWTRVENLLVQREEGPLHSAALAAYYLDPGSPAIPLPQLESWLDRYADAPRAGEILRLAQTRGTLREWRLPSEHQMVRQRGLTRRTLPARVNDGSLPQDMQDAILERIRNDDPDGARILLDGIDSALSAETRAEWRQRVAWSYYIENRDAEALAMARTVAEGSGVWVGEGEWIVGLAAWRLGDCRIAANGFERAAAIGASRPDTAAAAHYWASRALVRCREPEKAGDHLRQAARFTETLYGMLAREQLGQPMPDDHARPDVTRDDWQRLQRASGAREAVMLSRIGQDALADATLIHLVQTGNRELYQPAARLARALGLTGAQRYMAYNAPRGESAPSWLRWPVTDQQPVGGWRVDPALAFAHALQESDFREAVVSPAGAIGLMQITPITRREFAGSINMSTSADLTQPNTNLAFGQRTLEGYASGDYTSGQLPKVMAAYNAGPTPVSRWRTEIRDQGDPLTWMESIPYWETRSYVNIVMRNYWMYLRQAAAPAPSRSELAQNRWPQFPRER